MVLIFFGRCSRIPAACAAPNNCACAPGLGLAHKTKHAMTKHLALFASLGRLTLSLHIEAPRCVVRLLVLFASFATASQSAAGVLEEYIAHVHVHVHLYAVSVGQNAAFEGSRRRTS